MRNERRESPGEITSLVGFVLLFKNNLNMNWAAEGSNYDGNDYLRLFTTVYDFFTNFFVKETTRFFCLPKLAYSLIYVHIIFGP
jgi:hypothetical protein